MDKNDNVRWGWLKFMYWYTLVGAGGFGLGMLLVPRLIQTTLGFPEQDGVVFGVCGSVYAACGLLSILGLRSPLQFVPLLVFQLCYKSIWLVAIALPLFVSGHVPVHAVILLAIFATYIIGDLIAIPFPSVFAQQPES